MRNIGDVKDILTSEDVEKLLRSAEEVLRDETGLDYKTREMSKLGNRIHRYKRRLLKEAFRKAANAKINVVLPKDHLFLYESDDSKIFLRKDYDKNIDIDPLLNLVKDDFPSLYRRYYSAVQKYEKECQVLENMLAKVS